MRGRGSVLLIVAFGGCAMVGYEPEALPSSSPGGSVGAPGIVGGAGSGSAATSAGSGASSVGVPGAGAGTGASLAGSGGGDAGAPIDLPTSCSGLPDGELCDDGLFCTVGERCQGDICTGGTARECPDDSNGCASVKCEEAEQACIAMPMSEGLTCGGVGFCYRGHCTQLGGPCTEPSTCSKVCVPSSLPCFFDCSPSEECQVSCAPLSSCFVGCDGPEDCRLDCAQSAFCHMDCGEAESCEADCEAGSLCVVECEEAQDCTRLRCAAGAQCVALCAENAACGFEECAAGQITCPSGAVACGACPTAGSFGG